MTARYQVLLTGGVFDFQTRTVVTPDKGEWQEYRKWLSAGNVVLPPDTLGQDDLATAKSKRVAEIDAYAAALRNKVVAGRSAGEMASWAIKVMEAKAYALNPVDASAPVLAATAVIRGISTAALVQKVSDQSSPFLQAEAYIDGIRGKHCDAINAATDVRDIVVYDWLAGWPAIP